jgi:hypothetical protein
MTHVRLEQSYAMKQVIFGALLGLSCVALAASCASSGDEGPVEDLGAISEGLSKCAGGTLGDGNYCQNSCKCGLGEGDCDYATNCIVHPTLGQLQCSGRLSYFGSAVEGNACAPAHCNNRRKDGNETMVDCGGDCGTHCPGACDNLPANGTAAHCSTTCPCSAGNGGCDENNAECIAGTYCAANVGNYFGFANVIDVCLLNSCKNGTKDGTETGVDCGGPCLPCSGASTLSLAKGGSSFERGQDVAIDLAGEITVAGYFGGSVDFGGGGLTASGGSDIFVAKYNNVGSFGWSKRIGGSQADGDLNVSLAVALDATRALYLAGNYRGTIDLEGGQTHTAVSLSDAFIVKYSATGVTAWSRSYGSAGQAAVTINGLRAAPSGHIYAVGAFASPTITFGTTTLVNQGANGVWDGFVLKLDSSGNVVWARSFGSTSNDQATGIAVDADSTPYVTCSFVGTVEGMTSVGNQDGCLMKLSPTTGATTWARRLGGSFVDTATDVALDANGPVASGWFGNSMTFDDSSTATTTTYGGFVTAYDRNGTLRWKKAYTSTTGPVRASTISGGAEGVVAFGDFDGSVKFATTTVASVGGGRNGWMVRFNTAGGVVSSKTYGNPSALTAGATVSSNLLGITGEFRGTIDFGQGSMSSVGETDVFLGRLVY